MHYGFRIVTSFSLSIYLTVVVAGCSFLLIRFRMRADNLKIRARSPDLATFPAVYAIVVGGFLIPLQELLHLSGIEYPCRLTLVQSWLFLPVWGAPFALRSLRVLIASNKGVQDKYGFVLRKRTTLAMEGFLCTVAVVIIITLSQVLPPYSRGIDVSDRGDGKGACFMMMEWRFLLPFCILQTIIFGMLGYRLRTVDDLLNISNELRMNFMLYLLFGLPYFILQLHYRYRTDEDVPTYLQLLISAMVVFATVNTMWVSIGGVDDMYEFMGWERDHDEDDSTVGPSSQSGSVISAGGPSPVMSSVTRHDTQRWKQHYSDVPSIMRTERMSAVFGALANRFLCSESYEFLVSVSDYRGSSRLGSGPGLQHMLLIDICKTFVTVNSEQEINISHKDRCNILQYTDYREFAALTEGERADIFADAEREVSQMLELNLLRTFHNSDAFVQTCAAVDVEEHVWHLEEEKFLMAGERSPSNVDLEGAGIGLVPGTFGHTHAASNPTAAADDAAAAGDGGAAPAAVGVVRANVGSVVGDTETGVDHSHSTGGEDRASTRGGWGIGSRRQGSWRTSGSRLLAHLGLSSSVGPSR